MIYLITGIPGSGKSLYAVSTLIQSLMKDKLTIDDGQSGSVVIERRLVVDGIPSLLLPHELMAQGLVDKAKKTVTWPEEGDHFGAWPEWCKPGDILVVDELQRYCRPRSMGGVVPHFVSEMEVHRSTHSVDMVLLTQHPMLIDQNVRRQVGRHIHVRRLFGMQRAILYDWDGCQSDVSRVSTATKSYWAYPKEAFKLYHSADVHTKQKQKIPAWVAVPVLALVGGVMVAPTAYSTLMGAASGKGVGGAISSPPAAQMSSTPAIPATPTPTPSSGPAAVAAAAPPAPEPVFRGCVLVADRCACQNGAGQILKADLAQCVDVLRPGRPVADVSHLQDYPPRPRLQPNTLDLRF